MALLLAIETTTKNCSVALFKNNVLIDFHEEVSDKYVHAERLTLFIINLLFIFSTIISVINNFGHPYPLNMR